MNILDSAKKLLAYESGRGGVVFIHDEQLLNFVRTIVDGGIPDLNDDYDKRSPKFNVHAHQGEPKSSHDFYVSRCQTIFDLAMTVRHYNKYPDTDPSLICEQLTHYTWATQNDWASRLIDMRYGIKQP